MKNTMVGLNIPLSRHSDGLDQCYHYFTVIKGPGDVALVRLQLEAKLGWRDGEGREFCLVLFKILF